jgi:hypothetical protein
MLMLRQMLQHAAQGCELAIDGGRFGALLDACVGVRGDIRFPD